MGTKAYGVHIKRSSLSLAVRGSARTLNRPRARGGRVARAPAGPGFFPTPQYAAASLSLLRVLGCSTRGVVRRGGSLAESEVSDERKKKKKKKKRSRWFFLGSFGEE